MEATSPRAGGHCSVPKFSTEGVGSPLQHGGRSSRVPAQGWQRGCRDTPPRRSRVAAQQKARGSPPLRAGTGTQGAGSVPWQMPSMLPGLAGAEEPRRRARQRRRGRRQRCPQQAASCSFPAACPCASAGTRPLLPTPFCPARLPQPWSLEQRMGTGPGEPPCLHHQEKHKGAGVPRQ